MSQVERISNNKNTCFTAVKNTTRVSSQPVLPNGVKLIESGLHREMHSNRSNVRCLVKGIDKNGGWDGKKMNDRWRG